MAFHMSVPGTQSTFLVSDSRGRRPLGGSRDGEKTRSLGSQRGRERKGRDEYVCEEEGKWYLPGGQKEQGC